MILVTTFLTDVNIQYGIGPHAAFLKPNFLVRYVLYDLWLPFQANEKKMLNWLQIYEYLEFVWFGFFSSVMSMLDFKLNRAV